MPMKYKRTVIVFVLAFLAWEVSCQGNEDPLGASSEQEWSPENEHSQEAVTQHSPEANCTGIVNCSNVEEPAVNNPDDDDYGNTVDIQLGDLTKTEGAGSEIQGPPGSDVGSPIPKAPAPLNNATNVSNTTVPLESLPGPSKGPDEVPVNINPPSPASNTPSDTPSPLPNSPTTPSPPEPPPPTEPATVPPTLPPTVPPEPGVPPTSAAGNHSTAIASTTEHEEGPGEDVAPTVPATELEPAISLSIFLIFILLMVCSILVHLMIKYRVKFLPESIAFVLIGFIVGIFYNTIIPLVTHKDLTFHERFSPESFFLLILPPIIFESGYSLHKGNFFQNLGSIILFAVLGTAISTFIVGGGLVALSTLGVVYELTLVQCFSFGALISAVDPVATLAIFHALDVNPTLNMLVFGESVLNDAVSIVMTKTILQQSESDEAPAMMLLKSLGSFVLMFVGSAVIGIVFALASAVFLKYINLRKVYSLEFALWVLFAFGPYFFAEGLKLSGIMAVLFCGIVMSHYTHYNLSPVTQVTVQQTMRTVSFMAETVVFLYIGMQVFAIRTYFRVELIIWSLILILIGRAANIFPLSFLVNRFRSIKISSRMQFIMWFSGLRGAIAYALALNLVDQGSNFASKEVIQVLSTTTLVIVLFTILVFGGSTLPILKCLSKGSQGSDLTLSKTEDVGVAPAPSENQEEMLAPEPYSRERHQWFMRLDYRFFKPFLIRRFTKQEVRDARIEMQRRTNEWYQGLRAQSSEDEDKEDLAPGASKMVAPNLMETSLRERHSPHSLSSTSSTESVDSKTLPPLPA